VVRTVQAAEALAQVTLITARIIATEADRSIARAYLTRGT
jgi:hypothetical protein